MDEKKSELKSETNEKKQVILAKTVKNRAKHTCATQILSHEEDYSSFVE